MGEQAPENIVDEPVEWQGNPSPYDDLPVRNGVGVQDPAATELDPDVKATE